MWLTAPAAEAQSGEVALAGFAYSGAADTIEARFPYSKRYEASLSAVGDSVQARLRGATTQAVPQQLKLVAKIDELKGRDQAIAVALVINSETVSVEEFGKLRKLFVLVRGQTLLFDFKSMTVVRSYPVSFAYIDVFDRVPTSDEIGARVKLVYEGAVGKPGLFSRFANALAAASLPTQGSRQLQVTKVEVETGGSTTRRASESTWRLIPSANLNAVFATTFSRAGFKVSDAAFVEASAGGKFKVAAVEDDYKSGFDLKPATLQAVATGMRTARVPYVALGTLDVGLADTDPGTGLKRVAVRH